MSSTSTSFCKVKDREVICLFDRLKPNRSASLKVRVWLKPSTKGTVSSEFGHFSIDIPAGVDITNDEELERLDLQHDVAYKTFKTKILR